MTEFVDPLDAEWETYLREFLPEEGPYMLDDGTIVNEIQPTTETDAGLKLKADIQEMIRRDVETRRYLEGKG